MTKETPENLDEMLGCLPKLHEREKVVRDAEESLRDKLLAWQKVWSSKLTTAEYLSVLQRVLSESVASCLKYAIRHERHGTSDKPGGLE